jgi:dTDP-4-dehydrorhamnose 3,5-epimerase
VLLIKTVRFPDRRGWLSVTYNQKACAEASMSRRFCLENYSLSHIVGTVRGLHYQRPPKSQSKLIHVVTGRILDIALDLRKGSGRHADAELSAENGWQRCIRQSFAHGFITRAPDMIVGY